jgi:hypothetical protein
LFDDPDVIHFRLRQRPQASQKAFYNLAGRSGPFHCGLTWIFRPQHGGCGRTGTGFAIRALISISICQMSLWLNRRNLPSLRRT